MLVSALDKFGWIFVFSRKFGKLRQVAKRIAILKLQLQEDVAKELRGEKLQLQLAGLVTHSIPIS